jgi:3-oxoacyl-[acyl-carrier protein] reductase
MSHRALVTGGTKGLGLAIARALAARGDEVVATYAHDDAAANAAADAARADGLRLEVVRCDAASPEAVDAFFAQPASRDPGFDILVHAAGFTRDKLMMMMPVADFDAVLGVHLRGGFLVAKQAMKAMIARKWGRIVFVTSPTGQRGRPGQTNYGAAKAGLAGLCRSLAHEVGRFRITVNCVSAGLVDTAMTEGLSDAVRAQLLSGVALGRAGRPEEIAAAVSWITSDGAAYVTGQVLGVDGGLP